MNLNIVFYYLGWVLNIEAGLMLLPCIVSMIYRDGRLGSFLLSMAVCFVIGWITTHKKPKDTVFYAREGFLTVALAWLLLSFFGALPFWFSREIPSLIDAVFETISGFTTTGASILTDVEALSPSLLMWRSFTHWVGGMGVLVFMLALLPLVGGGYNMHLMRAESPGPSVGKLTPKVKSTAKILYLIYFVMTVILILLLLAGGMPLFDALAISFGTAGTGGFGIKNNSMAYYDSYYLQSVVTVGMILFGVNFNVYYLFLLKRFKEGFRCEEARLYLGIILASTLLITWNVRDLFPTILEAFHHAAFQVATIITTTGFSTVDFDLWPQFSKTILIGLMLIGACAGSTGGGMKVSRIVIAVKGAYINVRKLINPRYVPKAKFEGKTLEEKTIGDVFAFITMYFFLFVAAMFLLSFDPINGDVVAVVSDAGVYTAEHGFFSNFSAVLACISNVGPAFEAVGPYASFAGYSAFSKIVLSFTMILGRLEILPVFILFSPKTWKKV